MHWIDIVFTIVIGFSTVIGLFRGFAREAISLAAWFIAGFIAIRFSNELSYIFINHVEAEYIRYGMAFLLLFILTLIIAAFLRLIVVKLIKHTELTGTDRLLGLLFGFARGAVIVALVTVVIDATPFAGSATWQSSQVVPNVRLMTSSVSTLLTDRFPEGQGPIVREPSNNDKDVETRITAPDLETLKALEEQLNREVSEDEKRLLQELQKTIEQQKK